METKYIKAFGFVKLRKTKIITRPIVLLVIYSVSRGGQQMLQVRRNKLTPWLLE
jgi:hypothetical protein